MPHSDKYLINNSSAVVKANYPRPAARAKSCSCSSWSAQRTVLLATAGAASPVASNVHPGCPAAQPRACGRLIQTLLQAGSARNYRLRLTLRCLSARYTPAAKVSACELSWQSFWDGTFSQHFDNTAIFEFCERDGGSAGWLTCRQV